jgi:hypothetical protein
MDRFLVFHHVCVLTRASCALLRAPRPHPPVPEKGGVGVVCYDASEWATGRMTAVDMHVPQGKQGDCLPLLV